MRAQSKVLTFLQAPTTVFGMAPTHFFFVLSVSMMAGFIGSELTYGTIAFFLALVLAVLGFAWAIRLRRIDPHCETVLFRPSLFFTSGLLLLPLKNRRVLLAGQPLKIKRKKRRKK